MSYGMVNYTEDSIEISRYDKPIIAVRTKYITTGSGSVNIPGVYSHARVTMLPFYSLNVSVTGYSFAPSVQVLSDDTVVWSSAPYGATLLPCVMFAIFYK